MKPSLSFFCIVIGVVMLSVFDSELPRVIGFGLWAAGVLLALEILFTRWLVFVSLAWLGMGLLLLWRGTRVAEWAAHWPRGLLLVWLVTLTVILLRLRGKLAPYAGYRRDGAAPQQGIILSPLGGASAIQKQPGSEYFENTKIQAQEMADLASECASEGAYPRALVMSERAVAAYRILARDNDWYDRFVALQLLNVGVCCFKVGRYGDAVTVTKEAHTLFEDIASVDYRFQPEANLAKAKLRKYRMAQWLPWR